MNRDRDPLDRLRRANPVPATPAPSPDTPLARATFERIVASAPPAPERRRRSWRRRSWIIVPAIILLVAAGFGLFRETSKPIAIACFAQANIRADQVEVQPSGRDPVDACRPVWEPGGELNPSGQLPVPALEACVLAEGGIGVFPTHSGVDVCAVLGLPRPTSNPASQLEGEEIAKAQDNLSSAFLSRCVDQADAVTLTQQVLADNHLANWSVSTPTPFTSADPCASVAIDLAHRTVRLIPVSNPP